MANFFRYIGAAAPALNASARTALDIAREMREGPLREAESQGRQALTQQRMEQEKYEFEQKKKEDTEMDAPMDATLLWQGMSGKWTDEKQTYGKKMLQQQGIVDERGFTTRRKMEQAKKMIMLNKEATKWFQEAEIEGERMVGTDLMGKVSKAEESGDPGKIDEARSNFRKWNDKYQAKTKGFDQFNKTQTAYYLRDELQKKGILTKEMDAALSAAYKGGDGIDDVLKMLKEIKEKPDTSLTEAEILSLPDTDPRKSSYMKAKKEMERVTTKPNYDIIRNKETGEEKYIIEGSQIPKGWSTTKGTTGKVQGRGILQGGESVVFDPSTGINMVVSQTGESVPYDPSTHGDIQPYVQKQIPGGEVSKMAEVRNILKNISKAKDLYKLDTKKENSSWVGPVAGRVGSMERKYTGTATPEQVQFYDYIKDMEDALLRARSGAQINEQEYKRLVGFLPDPNLPPSSFKASLKRFEDQLSGLLQSKEEEFSSKGYRGTKKETRPLPTF